MVIRFIEEHKDQLIESAVAAVILLLIRITISYFVNRFSHRKNKVKQRANLVMKYVDFILIIIASIFAFLIWGINAKDIGVYASSIFALIGIGFFAQWSVLSNMTSGVIIFFTLPYKIGDRIKIHDKDFPIIAIIEDIKAFHMNLRTDDGGLHTYPNSLIMQKGVTLVEDGVATNIIEPTTETSEEDAFNKPV